METVYRKPFGAVLAGVLGMALLMGVLAATPAFAHDPDLLDGPPPHDNHPPKFADSIRCKVPEQAVQGEALTCSPTPLATDEDGDDLTYDFLADAKLGIESYLEMDENGAITVSEAGAGKFDLDGVTHFTVGAKVDDGNNHLAFTDIQIEVVEDAQDALEQGDGAPGKPTLQPAERRGPNTVRLTWDAAGVWEGVRDQGTNGYRYYRIVHRKIDEQDWSYPGVLAFGTTQTVDGLDPEEHYEFRVYALQWDAGGLVWGQMSNPVPTVPRSQAQAAEPTPEPTPEPVTEKPGNVRGLSATVNANGVLTITWEPPAEGGAASEYTVRYRTSRWFTVSGFTGTAIAITDLGSAEVKRVAVRAENDRGKSRWERARPVSTD